MPSRQDVPPSLPLILERIEKWENKKPLTDKGKIQRKTALTVLNELKDELHKKGTQ